MIRNISFALMLFTATFSLFGCGENDGTPQVVEQDELNAYLAEHPDSGVDLERTDSPVPSG